MRLLLKTVIDSIGSFVTISRELDLKTFVETSKIFGKLAITNQHHVKRINAMNVTLQLTQFTKDVSSMLLFCQVSFETKILRLHEKIILLLYYYKVDIIKSLKWTKVRSERVSKFVKLRFLTPEEFKKREKQRLDYVWKFI